MTVIHNFILGNILEDQKMNIRILILCFAFVSLPNIARNFSEIDGTLGRANMLKDLLLGGLLIGDNEESYQHLPEIRAVLRSSPNETLQQINSQLKGSGAQVVETKGSFVVFKTSLQQPVLMRGLRDSTNYEVVLNTKTNNFGILTGRQAVALKDIAYATVIANDYGMEIIKQYPNLRTAFYRVSSNINIVSLTTELKADIRVEYTYPEIIEHLAQPL